jgi:curved DNA-binding protein CbpA
MFNMNYYQLLGVPQTATTNEIKTAYRHLAVKHHPDKNPKFTKEADEKFKKIIEAYKILIDAVKRKTYDAGLPKKPVKQKKKRPSSPEELCDWLYKNDPNLGMHTIKDAPPPKFDVWGQPIVVEKFDPIEIPIKKTYKQNYRPIPEKKFIDVFAKDYVAEDVPTIRN